MFAFKVPQSIRYHPTVGIFAAPFNPPVAPGLYDFAAAAQNVILMTLLPNTVYILERISIGGDIAAEDYFDALETTPLLYIRKLPVNSTQPENLYETPIPIVGYTDASESTNFIHSEQGGQRIALAMTGQLHPTPALVGHATVSLHVNLAVYAVNEKYYNATFRDAASVGPLG